MKDLADFQAEAIARGYVHDFAFDLKSAPVEIANELRIVEYVSFDNGTDPNENSRLHAAKQTIMSINQ